MMRIFWTFLLGLRSWYSVMQQELSSAVAQQNVEISSWISLIIMAQLQDLNTIMQEKKWFYHSDGETVLMEAQHPVAPVPSTAVSPHHNDVIMGVIESQIISLTIVYSTVYSMADQRKHQSSALLTFVQGIYWWLVSSPRKRPVTRKIFPFDDVIMQTQWCTSLQGKVLFVVVGHRRGSPEHSGTVVAACVSAPEKGYIMPVWVLDSIWHTQRVPPVSTTMYLWSITSVKRIRGGGGASHVRLLKALWRWLARLHYPCAKVTNAPNATTSANWGCWRPFTSVFSMSSLNWKSQIFIKNWRPCFLSSYNCTNILCLLLLISMLWHRQAIFASKGDKLRSSAQCRIRNRVSGTESLADWMPADKLTELSRIELKTWTQ